MISREMQQGPVLVAVVMRGGAEPGVGDEGGGVGRELSRWPVYRANSFPRLPPDGSDEEIVILTEPSEIVVLALVW